MLYINISHHFPYIVPVVYSFSNNHKFSILPFKHVMELQVLTTIPFMKIQPKEVKSAIKKSASTLSI